ncbi:NAD(P)/FAD-dependent oxidoreductase [Terrarubrum flagellatum]|uniref:NAD(P)/FAD-dependent oxidoreductase n=1 Tax=Terrirubrum flagellatum TaxID=2895980 RepID=UPI003144D612
MNASSPQGLAALEARLQQDLEWLELPSKSWIPPRFVGERRVRDVVIMGAGMAGLVASGMLKRLGVDNHILFDAAPAGREGPWVTFARMRNLRSPKQLTGPAMGLPALTFRAFYEAQFGREAWNALGKIPRPLWMDYLIWYRKVLALPVQNDTFVSDVADAGDGLLSLSVTRAGVAETEYARRLVLATGRDGLGGPYLPEIAYRIDPQFRAHSADDIDFAALKGRRVAVIGAGASSMDNAATALEAGAARMDLFIRRSDIPRINKMTGIGSQGVVHGFAGLPDEWKWRFLDYAMREQTPPPRDSTLRVSQHASAHFHLSSPIMDLSQDGDHVVIETPKGRYPVDFVVFGTGFKVDLASRPELAAFAPHIRLWSDGSIPEGVNPNAELAGSPYLGESFEFQEKTPGACPALGSIYCFNFPATLSHGKLTGDIPAISEGADRLARGLTRSLFVEDRAAHYANLEAFATPELLGDEWADADAPDLMDAA